MSPVWLDDRTISSEIRLCNIFAACSQPFYRLKQLLGMPKVICRRPNQWHIMHRTKLWHFTVNISNFNRSFITRHWNLPVRW